MCANYMMIFEKVVDRIFWHNEMLMHHVTIKHSDGLRIDIRCKLIGYDFDTKEHYIVLDNGYRLTITDNVDVYLV